MTEFVVNYLCYLLTKLIVNYLCYLLTELKFIVNEIYAWSNTSSSSILLGYFGAYMLTTSISLCISAKTVICSWPMDARI